MESKSLQATLDETVSSTVTKRDRTKSEEHDAKLPLDFGCWYTTKPKVRGHLCVDYQSSDTSYSAQIQIASRPKTENKTVTKKLKVKQTVTVKKPKATNNEPTWYCAIKDHEWY